MQHAAFIALLIFSKTSFALPDRPARGGFVGNGGDLVRCEFSLTSEFAGELSLDYVLERMHDRSPLDTVRSYQGSFARILDLLGRNAPSLASSLQEFVGDFLNTHESRAMVWRNFPLYSFEIRDEHIANQLPTNCRRPGEPFVYLLQAAIREKHGDTILYFYDNHLGSMLTNPSPAMAMQASFVLIHEWLWNVSADAAMNRKLNYYLHSSAARTDDSDTFLAKLSDIGLRLDPQ